ncbi:protein kinase [Streptomyces sp. NPDC004647]|uniref:serine/threonine-protein kinase n=1 Tax=Streptomyces sp. NPDC004647 TaxID=3154671 RepID=UPI0033A1C732
MLVAERYRLDTAIGRGGMGEVWRATDEVLGRPVAVKLLLGSETDEQAGARFRLEAQTAARLNHPHVVTVFDFGCWNERFYLVMELVEGISLAQDLAAGAVFGPQSVAQIAAQAAAGLSAAHRQGVIHRDIKPGNLMRDADGTVKISDFGIARFVDDASAALTSTGQIVGTSLYLAPERALGKPTGPGSDVYALGCVLYNLLAGHPPFQADTPTAVLYMHVDAQPARLSLRRPEIPRAFEDFLFRMLAKDPQDRPSAQDVADWFAGPAWRGSDTQRMTTPDGPDAATTYGLPKTTFQPTVGASRHRAPREGQYAAPGTQPQLLLRIRPQIRRHKLLTGVVAGIGAFVVATLLGMAWFSPDSSGSARPGDKSSQVADPAPTTSRSPSPAVSEPVTPAASPTGLPAEVLEENEDKGDRHNRWKHEGREDNDGDHGDDDD